MKLNFKPAILGALLLLFAGCDKSDDPLGSLSDVYIPDFSNDWSVVKGPGLNSQFFINSTVTDSSKGTGTLEAHEQNGTDDFNLKGSFDNLSVKLNYLTNAENNSVDNGPHAGFAYSGKVDTLSKPILLRLANVNNTSDSLVLKHG